MGLRNLFFKPSSPSSSLRKTFSDSLVGENIELARSLITKWDPLLNKQSLFNNTREEPKQFLNAVNDLQSTMMHLVSQDSSSDKLVQAQMLMQLAMKRLENEFYRILSENKDYLNPESIAVNDNSVSIVAMEDLREIAECMVKNGYSKECVKIYINVRKSIVDETLYNEGVERLTFSQVQKMDLEFLELKIKCWLNAVKVAVGDLFSSERNLCDYVFGEKNKIVESCFAEICKESATYLFGFPEYVAKRKKTHERIFRILDLYEAIFDNWPQIESIFSFESTSSIRSHAISSMVRLAETVRAMLSDLESAIQKESSKIPVPGGGVHPLTRYVMNYMAFLADYSGVLADIVSDWSQTPLPESYYRRPGGEENPSSELAERLAWLILVVLCKLDEKAEFYKDVSQSYLFLANNMQYVVVKVRNSKLGFLLGEDWLTKHEAKVREYVSKYEHVGWNKVLTSLSENPTVDMPEEKVKAMFLSFNAVFHEACRTQVSWVVPDPKLRNEIKMSITSKLVTKYRKFYDKCNRVGFESMGPDDLGNYLSSILNGMRDSGSVSSHYSSSHHRFNHH